MDSTLSDEKSKKFWKQSNWEKIFHSQKFICYRYDETAKTYPKQGKKFCKSFDRKFNMENNERSISKEVIFEIEDKAFAEGDFRMAYKAAEGGFRKAYKAKSYDESFRGNTWVDKIYNVSSKETFEKMREPYESQSRKAVQMKCLARYWMLIVLQIHEVSFEIFFQYFMKFFPPVFNLKF